MFYSNAGTRIFLEKGAHRILSLRVLENRFPRAFQRKSSGKTEFPGNRASSEFGKSIESAELTKSHRKLSVG